MVSMSTKSVIALVVTWCLCGGASAQCGPKPSSPQLHDLKATKDTIHWGYIWNQNKPKLYVHSGDRVDVEMLSHMGGDYYNGMVQGDPALEEIYKWVDEPGAITTRGATGAGDGVHLLTGPIYVCDAEEGDILQIDILKLSPRPNPATGKTYGVNGAARWGYQYRTGYLQGGLREVSTVYEIISDEKGNALWAVPDFQFRYGNTTNYSGPVTSCAVLNGTYPNALQNLTWSNPSSTFRGGYVPCTDGQMTWMGYLYPGVKTIHPTGTEDYSIRGKFRVPLNFHIGNIGLAPKYDVPLSAVPPGNFGGNMDNRRIGVGATLYIKVQSKGALLHMGDTHAAQGDSEFDGMAIETSLNGRLRLTLHKAATAPAMVKDLTFPLIENSESYIVQGYAYNDFLNAPELQPNPGRQVLVPGSDLNKAFLGAFTSARQWLMDWKNMTEDQIVTFITVTCDFQTTQVVDGNWGVHLMIPKYAFATEAKKAFRPRTVCGSSVDLPKSCKF